MLADGDQEIQANWIVGLKVPASLFSHCSSTSWLGGGGGGELSHVLCICMFCDPFASEELDCSLLYGFKTLPRGNLC